MKLAMGWALALWLLATPPAYADDQSDRAAIRFLDAMNMEKVLKDTVNASLEAELAQKPEMAPYRQVFVAFFDKHMRYEVVKPRLAAVYAAEFSAAELDQATAFYSTPAGRKFLTKLPILINKGAEIGQALIAEHLPELERDIRAESERLQKLSQPEDGG